MERKSVSRCFSAVYELGLFLFSKILNIGILTQETKSRFTSVECETPQNSWQSHISSIGSNSFQNFTAKIRFQGQDPCKSETGQGVSACLS
jgi:hypothetical protein